MDIPLFQIDAFASKNFEGNPAAVCPLNSWLPDATMQAIANENNLSETAFFVKNDVRYHIRWFTPVTEVDLCGHATLASAWVIFNELKHQHDSIHFDSLSGPLEVTRQDNQLTLDFPASPPKPCPTPPAILEAFDTTPVECLKAEDYIAVFENESDIQTAQPDMAALKRLDGRGVVITAPGKNNRQKHDFVSRFFAPNFGIDEDPVTGSAFTQLAPYWANKLDATTLSARQLSKRGGEVTCQIKGDRVLISGTAVKYLTGTISI